ncbi:MAG: DUF58 domain-containing protein [Myxococcota bacterium]
MIPTNRLVIALGFVGFAAFITVPLFGALPTIGVLVALLVVAVADVLVLNAAPRPRVTVEVSPVAQLRRSTELLIRTSRPITVALSLGPELGGPYPSLSVAASRSLPVTPRSRGRHELGELWALESSRVGFWTRRTVLNSLQALDVWPDLRDEDVVPGPSEGSGNHPQPASGSAVSLELRSLRPFVSGDDVRHVDWKASAKHQLPVVREWEPERRRTVIFALDGGRLMRAMARGENKFDAALRAVARVAAAASVNGDRVGALVFDETARRFIPPLEGRGQEITLLRQLNDIAPSLVQSDLRPAIPFLLSHRRRCLVIVLSDIVDQEDVLLLSGALDELRGTHLPAVALLRDPEVDVLADTPEDPYLRAAARSLRKNRELAVATLAARGTYAVDVPTSRLASQVLDTYTRARASAAW